MNKQSKQHKGLEHYSRSMSKRRLRMIIQGDVNEDEVAVRERQYPTREMMQQWEDEEDCDNIA